MSFSQIKDTLSACLKNGLIDFYISVFVVVLLPVYHWYLTPFMILWGILWLISIKNNIPFSQDVFMVKIILHSIIFPPTLQIFKF